MTRASCKTVEQDILGRVDRMRGVEGGTLNIPNGPWCCSMDPRPDGMADHSLDPAHRPGRRLPYGLAQQPHCICPHSWVGSANQVGVARTPAPPRSVSEGGYGCPTADRPTATRVLRPAVRSNPNASERDSVPVPSSSMKRVRPGCQSRKSLRALGRARRSGARPTMRQPGNRPDELEGR